ncbi:MAG: hypothetical protein IH984_06180 [Planctomycetes bacterium]|nr:hypothetical protein [Planctomycetota bacterium]
MGKRQPVPRLTDLVVEFENHRLPLVTVSTNRSDLCSSISSYVGSGIDVAERVEAVIFGFSGGRLVVYEAGAVDLKLRQVAISEAKNLLLDFLKKLCTIFRWDIQGETFAIEADLQIDADAPQDFDVAVKLGALCDLDKLQKLCGLKKKPSSVGYSLGLGELRDNNRDTRLRIAPLRLEPAGKIHLHISDFRRHLQLAELDAHIEKVAKTLMSVVRSVEKKK